LLLLFFFFSSRRRHTRSYGDWSSDVCSSDLFHAQYGLEKVAAGDMTAICVFAGSFMRPVGGALADRFGGSRVLTLLYGAVGCLRSEERRVGKECRCRGGGGSCRERGGCGDEE